MDRTGRQAYPGMGSKHSIGSAILAGRKVSDRYFPLCRLYKSQSQAVALGGVGSVPLIKLFKNVRSDFRADPAAGIADLHDGMISLRL